MQDERDYYTILGVPANAPETDIRKAFRARAKELHPDSKPAGERELASREFNLLTEAYDTLKDAERRADYDLELRHSRQIMRVEQPGHSAGAMVMGVAVAVLLVGAAIGGILFYDRVAKTPKNQETLRITKAPQLPQAPEAPIEDSARAPAVVDNSRLAPVPAPAEPRIEPDQERTKQAWQAPVPAVPAHAKEPPPPPAPEHAPRSQFAGEVLLLESQTSSDPGGVAVYKLVSLVNSATDIGQLSEAAELAGKQETVELLNGRIEALKEEQEKALASAPKPQETPAPQTPQPAAAASASASSSAKGDNIFDIPTGVRSNETILRLHPGSGLKESFSDCASCPEMVTVPGGQTIVGSRPEVRGYRPEEGPAHKVVIQKPFAVSKHGISAENWRACVDAGICRPTLASYLTAGPGIAATRISWFDAKTYVEWLSKTTSRRYRLLTEAEWEYVAQASKAAETAQKPDGHANAAAGLKQLAADTKPNGWGIYPLPVNLLEWVEDCWHQNYTQAPQDGSPWLSGNGGDCAYRVVRGMAAASGGDFGGRRLSGRARESADARTPTLGFRVARDIVVLSKTALETSGAKRGE
jgi:formylglycine-generating enzyme required for sulfatase activity/curved DNA-binding protein CbpA